MSGSGTADVIVAGQIARDLVLVVDDVPGAGQSAAVRQRREMLGGKGANQAVALAQLGMRVALLGVVGDDDAGQQALDQARADGIDVSAVQRRDGTATGLVVDVVDRAGRWHYLEDLPPSVLLTETDVAAGASLASHPDLLPRIEDRFKGILWILHTNEDGPDASIERIEQVSALRDGRAGDGFSFPNVMKFRDEPITGDL
jgi:hypothetical protein